MSVIDRLSIQGIRSYNPAEPVKIKFFKPLTIIVGQNGSGKTTIIEALKFACTGEPPQLTEKGKTWIHDPKRAGTSKVKAQVKMSFQTPGGRMMLAIHSLEVIQKKNSRQLKSIDGVIRFLSDEGKTVALSRKCADMKKTVPSMLGVSKAILENVIFCHQEDSCWPLEQAKKLKEKFDDIFSATRYTKAMKNIKDIKKEKNLASKGLDADLKILQSDVDEAGRMQREVEEIKVRMATYKDRQRKAQEKIDKVNEELKPLLAKKQEFETITARITALRQFGHDLKKQRKDAYSRMGSEFQETDEELRKHIRVQQERKEEQNRTMEEQKRKAEAYTRQLQAKEKEIAEMNKELGKAQARVEANKKRIEQLQVNAKAAATKYDIPGFDDPKAMTLEDIESCRKAIQKVFKSQKDTLAKEKARGQKEDDQFTKAITELENERGKLQTQKRERQNERNRNQTRVQRLEEKSERITTELRRTQDVQAKLEKEQKTLDKRKKSGAADKWQDSLNEKQSAMEDNSREISRLSKEMSTLRAQGEQLTRLKCQRESVTQKEKRANDLLDEIRQPVTDELGRLPPIARLHDDVQAEFRNVKKKLAKASDKASKLQNAVSMLAATISSKKQTSAQLTKKIRQCERKIRNRVEIPEGTTLMDIIKSGKEKLQDAKDGLQLKMVSALMYKKFNKIATKKGVCAICKRAFCDDDETNKFITENTKRMEAGKNSDDMIKAKSDVSNLEKNQHILEELIPTATELSQHKEKQKGIQDEAGDLQKRYQDAKESATKSKDVEKGLQSSQEKLMSLAQRSRAVVQAHTELTRAKEQLEQDEARFKARSGDQRNLSQVEAEYTSKTEANTRLNKEIQQLQRKIQAHQKETQRLQERVNLLQKHALERQTKVNEKTKLEQEVKELNRTIDMLNTQIEGLTTQAAPLDSKIEQREKERTKARQIRRDEWAGLEKTINETRERIQIISRSQAEVRKFQGGEREMQEYTDQLEAQKAEVTKYRKEKQEAEKKQKKAMDWLQDNMNTEKEMQANLDYREVSRRFEKHRVDFGLLKDQLNEMANEGVDTDLPSMIKNLNEKIDEHKQVHSEAEGAMGSETRKAKELVERLKSDKYREVSELHRKKLIEVETTKLAMEDLERFSKALDRALLQFHSEKMKEINSVLKNLWQTIYRGKDIEYIQIKSEEATTSKKKSYEYSVVMRAGDSEMDMRGRCSAGQRVLACLLIRIALAETFCAQCGILALDEPTTNLDEANIKALARALNSIIKRRREQANFQMICITHDDDFVEELGQREHADGFYRVYKGEDQFSQVRRMMF